MRVEWPSWPTRCRRLIGAGQVPDTALPFFGVSYQASGPLATQAITTDGSTGWAETTVEYTNPETFTVLVWLKTSSAQGAIVGFASSQNPTTGTPADHDRQLWIDPSGKLVWGIYDAAVDQLTSTSAVDTGSWVFAAASVGSSGTALYVNGTLVASSSSVTAAQSYSGWWSVGYASLAGWTDIPTSYYFNGSIAQLAVIPSQLSATQVSNLYADSTLSTYTTGVNALGPANYWALNDPGSVSYEGSVPGATTSTTLADASGNGNTGTAEGGSTLGATGPTALGVSSAVALNGSTGYVQTTNSYANPEGFSLVAWFKSSSTSGGTIMGFANVQGNGTPAEWDRLLWIDNTGHLVWGVYNNAFDEITSPSAYNNGAWHMVVAEVGSSGTQLYVDNTEVASNASYTTAQSYTGYWHLGWGYEIKLDRPTDKQLLLRLLERSRGDTHTADCLTDLGHLQRGQHRGACHVHRRALVHLLLAPSGLRVECLRHERDHRAGDPRIDEHLCLPARGRRDRLPDSELQLPLDRSRDSVKFRRSHLRFPCHRHCEDGALGCVGVRADGPAHAARPIPRYCPLPYDMVRRFVLPCRIGRVVSGGLS